MKTLKFKTNINCNNCVAAAKPFLDKIKHQQGWHVDITNPDKVLTVEGDAVETANVVEMVQEAGYRAEPKKGLLGKLFG